MAIGKFRRPKTLKNMDIEDVFPRMFAMFFYSLIMLHLPKPDVKSPHRQGAWKSVVVESQGKRPYSISRFRRNTGK